MKKFPSDTSMDYLTFLNDSKINGELYAYLLSKAVQLEGEARVYKSDLPNQTEIGAILSEKPLTRKTVSVHMKYLKEKELICDKGKYYLIFNPELYVGLSEEVVQFLVHTVKEQVTKTFIYLCARQSWAEKRGTPYNFTIKELCEHLGLSYDRGRVLINNYLAVLTNCNLVQLKEIYIDKLPYYQLVGVETQKAPKIKKK